MNRYHRLQLSRTTQLDTPRVDEPNSDISDLGPTIIRSKSCIPRIHPFSRIPTYRAKKGRHASCWIAAHASQRCRNLSPSPSTLYIYKKKTQASQDIVQHFWKTLSYAENIESRPQAHGESQLLHASPARLTGAASPSH